MIEGKEKLKQFYVGQRVLYSGRTSYNYPGDGKINGVLKEPGTIITIGNSISIALDDYRKPYYVKDSAPGVNGAYVIPQKHYATLNIGEFVSGEKKIEPLCEV